VDIEDCGPYLAGRLDAVNAFKALSRERNMSKQTDPLVATSECTCERPDQPAQSKEPEVAKSSGAEPAPVRVAQEASAPAVAPPASKPAVAPPAPAVAPSAYEDTDGKGLVFFIGLVGYDFGTEARRDTFKQQMPAALFNYTTGHLVSEAGLTQDQINTFLQEGFQRVPPNPFDTRQMVEYLRFKPDEARSLIWTLNLELTPVYSIEPVGPFANLVYERLTSMLDGQSQAEGSPAYVERVSVPAVLSGQSVRLFSGQVVSQLLVDATRGMYNWNTSALIESALATLAKVREARAAASEAQPPSEDEMRRLLRHVLNKLYYEYRNLGVTSPDRALNFAATNIFQLTTTLVNALTDPKGSKTLERIDVVRSPYCRVDSDCWDVLLKFFDPESTRRAYEVTRFALDVSDKLPVTLGPFVVYSSTT
jgi:hypothetical protein